MNKHNMTHQLVESGKVGEQTQGEDKPYTCPLAYCIWFMQRTIIFYIITYRLLGELGAAGLRAPP